MVLELLKTLHMQLEVTTKNLQLVPVNIVIFVFLVFILLKLSLPVKESAVTKSKLIANKLQDFETMVYIL